jgi:hypothetical protein
MKRPHQILLGIIIGGFLLRLILLQFIQHPGLNDPNHYYNLGVRLLHGEGFTMDYLWHYYNPPESMVHPFDFWQPLAGILAALGMWFFGEGVQQAVFPFVVLGSLLPLVSYFAAKQFKCSEISSLFVAAATAVLPEYVLNSLHTDTLIPNALFVGAMMIFLVKGLQNEKWWHFILSGVFAGLAYWVRGDNLLLIPMLLVTVVAYVIWGREITSKHSWQMAWLMPIIGLVIATPWLVRNIQEFASWSSASGLTDVMFYTDFRDHYHYEREFSLETLLEQQSISQILGKRIFEGAAAIRMMLTTLDFVLPLAVLGGTLFILSDRKRLLTLVPTIILLGGMFFVYVILMPISNQGGSFKKSYLTLVPMLLPLAAYALDRVIEKDWHKIGAAVLTILLMTQSAIMLQVGDFGAIQRYTGYMDVFVEIAKALPDTNGDGELIFMAQDPFMLHFRGYRAVQIPMEDRETILEVAQRYNVDYILFPPARPSLDPIYNGDESDSRFVYVADIILGGQIYRFDYEAEVTGDKDS